VIEKSPEIPKLEEMVVEMILTWYVFAAASVAEIFHV
jgi:hypothetical protein